MSRITAGNSYYIALFITIFAIIVCHIFLDRMRNYFEDRDKPNDDVTYLSMENEAAVSLEMNSLWKIKQVNNCLIIALPAVNGLFYGIYFYLTVK